MACKKFDNILNNIKRTLLIYIVCQCKSCRYNKECSSKDMYKCKQAVIDLLKAIKGAKDVY